MINKSNELTLDVFWDGQGWNWAVVAQRPNVGGFKIVAFGEEEFGSEAEARSRGIGVLDRLRAPEKGYF